MAEDYWIKRERDHINKSIKDDKLIAKKLKENYDRALNEITKEIDAFYNKYAAKEGISMSEAIQKVAESDTKAFASKAKQYVKEKNFSDEANEQLRLYNATMKINRLEMLKANIGLELTAMSNEESIITRSALQKNVYDEFERQAGILGETVISNDKVVQSIVNASFQNATFSQRIWSNHDALKSDLDKLLSRGMIQGKNPRVLARELKKTLGVSLNQAERLMITEMARVQTGAQETAFKEYGYEECTWIAEPSACNICKPNDGKVFKVSDIGTGEVMIPAHPHCRCSFAAYYDRDEFEKRMAEIEQVKKESGELDVDSIKLKGKPASDQIRSKTDVFNDREKEVKDIESKLEATNKKLKEAKTGGDKALRKKMLGELEDDYDDGLISTNEYNEGLAKVREMFKNKADGTDLRSKYLDEIQQLTNELNNLKQKNVIDNANDVKEILSQYRSMGVKDVDFTGHILKPNSQVSKFVKNAYDYYPTDWIKKSVKFSEIETKITKRAYYNNLGDLTVSKNADGTLNLRTAIHELSHRFEHAHPDLVKLEKEFFELRTKGDETQSLRKLTGNASYKKDEVAKPDNFLSPYMGKVYESDSYELLSMGVDTLYADPTKLMKDPDMFEWITGMLLTH